MQFYTLFSSFISLHSPSSKNLFVIHKIQTGPSLYSLHPTTPAGFNIHLIPPSSKK